MAFIHVRVFTGLVERSYYFSADLGWVGALHILRYWRRIRPNAFLLRVGGCVRRKSHAEYRRRIFLRKHGVVRLKCL